MEINKTASPLILPFPAFFLLACDSAKSIVILALGLRWRTKHQNPRPKDATVVKQRIRQIRGGELHWLVVPVEQGSHV